MNKQKIFNKKILLWIIFILYALFNLFLMLKHEPWRDEIHAWLMSKELSIPELFKESRFDGHPILWHLILMPFAKSGFPIITLNIIGYVITVISAWIFLFKTNLSTMFKIIVIFTIPFTYTYSAISRNYTLILFLLVLISILYDQRFKKPILYSLLISLLIHTHALAWGIVAGLTITFHFHEIYLYFKNKNNADIKKIILGLSLIILNTILVVFELYGTTNTDYGVGKNTYVIYCTSLMLFIVCILLALTFTYKKNYRELFILFSGFVFQIIIYNFVYSSILYQRYILIFVLLLFYLILLSKCDIKKKDLDIICIVYLLFMCLFASKSYINSISDDLKYPYSSAKEMATYINKNLPENSTVLIEASVIGQSIIPYLDNAKLYDITYNSYVNCANVSDNKSKIINALNNLDSSYSGHYIIICNNFVSLNNCDLIYETKNSIINEKFTMYYIP